MFFPPIIIENCINLIKNNVIEKIIEILLQKITTKILLDHFQINYVKRFFFNKMMNFVLWDSAKPEVDW